MKKATGLMSGFLTVGAWTLLSRILGFVRDVLIAGYLGSTPVAQAFLVAFSLPNMFRRLFAEGAFNAAFVPQFTKKLGDEAEAQRFAHEAFAWLASILIAISLIAQLCMPALVLLMAAGFAGDERFALAVLFGRITFGYIILISLAALLSGLLNALGRFAAAAAAPVLLNVVLIAALALGGAGFGTGFGARLLGAGEVSAAGTAQVEGLHIGLLLSWGVVLAGIAQLALLWRAAAMAGFGMRLRLPRLTPQMRQLGAVAAPAMLAGGVVQVNLLVGRQVASQFDGAIAWLSYADRLYQLPLGVVGIAIGVVLLPSLSRHLRAQDGPGARDALSRAAEVSLALTIPSAMALMVVPGPLVSVLFERGEFTAADTRATALAVTVYAAGLPAFVLQKVLQPVFFARENTRSPFRYALWAMLVNALIAVLGALSFGFVGAALGTTIAGWAMVAMLLRGARAYGQEAQLDTRFRQRLGRIVLASALMSLWLGWLAWALGPWLGAAGWRYAALAVLVSSGMAVYFGSAHALGAIRFAELRGALRRRARRQ